MNVRGELEGFFANSGDSDVAADRNVDRNVRASGQNEPLQGLQKQRKTAGQSCWPAVFAENTPPGITAETAVLQGKLARESRQAFPLHFRANAGAQTGVYLVAFDVTLEGCRMGERFDCIVNIER